MKRYFRFKKLFTLLLIMTVGYGMYYWFARAASGNFRLVNQWGGKGSAPGQFDEPIGIAIDKNGFVYVSDARNARIQKFDAEGEFILQWGSYGKDAGQFEKPIGIAVDSNNRVYVSDYDLDRIQVFEESGTYLFQWGKSGKNNGEFNAPAGIGIDPKGNVFVSDFYNHRVQKFKDDGGFLRIIGSSGRFWSGALHYPTDVSVDEGGNIFVADTYNHRIQKFLPDGRFCHKWGGPFGWGIPGKWLGWFKVPSGIARDVSGLIFVADSANRRVVALTAAGSFLNSWSLQNSMQSIIHSPTRVAVGKNSMIYVVDTEKHKVVMLRFQR